MTIASHEYSDEEFAKLVEQFGPDQAACMVLHLAYFNFHDRLMIVLGVEHGADDPVLAPINVKFDFKPATPTSSSSTASSSSATNPSTVDKNVVSKDRVAWLDYDGLQKQLQIQRERKPRLTPPDWSTIAPKIPAGMME